MGGKAGLAPNQFVSAIASYQRELYIHSHRMEKEPRVHNGRLHIQFLSLIVRDKACFPMCVFWTGGRSPIESDF